MTVDTSEKDFEATIEADLLASGFRKRQPQDYDRALCLDPGPLFDFIRATQIRTWDKLKQQHGSEVKERFLKRLVRQIEDRGTLDCLWKGVTDLGCHFDLAYFKPETGLNPEHQKLYSANAFSIVRQLRFSEKSEKSIDVGIFLNGIPILTAELKNPLKGQKVENAVWQYRKDRDPREPLFRFGRCLAHFAVDPDLVFMTTRLQRTATSFLPFNLGHDSGAGNPPNAEGFRTEYLWKRIWQPDSLLEIVNHFLRVVDLLDEDGKPTGDKALIFPRYHQLDAVRRLVAHAKETGSGQSYLIEHSAGSGKSNTIAWVAHQLAGLHDYHDARVFDSIIVITDRRVLDWQLQQTVKSFEQTRGLVSAIDKQKARKLTEALEVGKDIIVTTLQTFPFVTDRISQVRGKNFAVLIDEAHSSQTGETARSMKRTLAATTLEEAAEEERDEGPDDEDAVNARVEELIKKGGRLPNVSFFAFTATPKPKTLELFGVPRADGQFEPFSLYSMKQAIEENFILDVLKNYTTFKVYFGLHKRIEDDPAYPRKKSIALLKSYADLHDHAIRSKSEIIIEHFDTQVKGRIGGRAKAMVVTRSRLHAVRYKRMFDNVLKEQELPYQALVAFSGTVKDRDTGQEYTEARMNGYPESQTAPVFRKPEYRFLIVAEKFQTGFDQPLLDAMYVDKKLAGVNAVQTLSRLNRMHPDKPDTVVLDFVNEADDIKTGFQPYYEATLLSEATDPNKLYDLKRAAEEYLIFLKSDVDAFSKAYFSKKGTQKKVRAVLDPLVDRYRERDGEQQEDFRRSVVNYVRMYGFLSHILRFRDVDLEKTYHFLRLLRPLLLMERERLPVEVTDKINMDRYRIQQTSTGDIALEDNDGQLKPASDVGTGADKQNEKAPLSEILQYLNDNFGTEFTDADKVAYFAEDMERRLVDQDGLHQALDPEINRSEENRRLAFNDYFNEVLEDMFEANAEIYKKIVDDERFGDIFRLAIFRRVVDSLKGDAA